MCRSQRINGLKGFAPLRSENGYRLCPLWSEFGYGFRGKMNAKLKSDRRIPNGIKETCLLAFYCKQ